MTYRSWAFSIAVMLAGGVLLAGCSDPAARRMTIDRQRRIAMWLGEAAEREREGAASAGRGLAEIGEIWRHDAARTRENTRKVEQFISEENQRWRRRQPAFVAEIVERSAGDLEHARKTAVWMFF